MTTYQLDYLRLTAKELIEGIDCSAAIAEVWAAMSDRERAEVNDAAMVVFGEWR